MEACAAALGGSHGELAAALRARARLAERVSAAAASSFAGGAEGKPASAFGSAAPGAEASAPGPVLGRLSARSAAAGATLGAAAEARDEASLDATLAAVDGAMARPGGAEAALPAAGERPPPPGADGPSPEAAVLHAFAPMRTAGWPPLEPGEPWGSGASGTATALPASVRLALVCMGAGAFPRAVSDAVAALSDPGAGVGGSPPELSDATGAPAKPDAGASSSSSPREARTAGGAAPPGRSLAWAKCEKLRRAAAALHASAGDTVAARRLVASLGDGGGSDAAAFLDGPALAPWHTVLSLARLAGSTAGSATLVNAGAAVAAAAAPPASLGGEPAPPPTNVPALVLQSAGDAVSGATSGAVRGAGAVAVDLCAARIRFRYASPAELAGAGAGQPGGAPVGGGAAGRSRHIAVGPHDGFKSDLWVGGSAGPSLAPPPRSSLPLLPADGAAAPEPGPALSLLPPEEGSRHHWSGPTYPSIDLAAARRRTDLTPAAAAALRAALAAEAASGGDGRMVAEAAAAAESGLRPSAIVTILAATETTKPLRSPNRLAFQRRPMPADGAAHQAPLSRFWPLPHAFATREAAATSAWLSDAPPVWDWRLPLPPAPPRPVLLTDPARQAHEPALAALAIRTLRFPVDVYDLQSCPMTDRLHAQAVRRSAEASGLQRSVVWPVYAVQDAAPSPASPWHGAVPAEPDVGDASAVASPDGSAAPQAWPVLPPSRRRWLDGLPVLGTERRTSLVGPVGFMAMSDDASVAHLTGAADKRRRRVSALLVLCPADYPRLWGLLSELHAAAAADPGIRQRWETRAGEQAADPEARWRHLREAVGRIAGWQSRFERYCAALPVEYHASLRQCMTRYSLGRVTASALDGGRADPAVGQAVRRAAALEETAQLVLSDAVRARAALEEAVEREEASVRRAAAARGALERAAVAAAVAGDAAAGEAEADAPGDGDTDSVMGPPAAEAWEAMSVVSAAYSAVHSVVSVGGGGPDEDDGPMSDVGVLSDAVEDDVGALSDADSLPSRAARAAVLAAVQQRAPAEAARPGTPLAPGGDDDDDGDDALNSSSSSSAAAAVDGGPAAAAAGSHRGSKRSSLIASMLASLGHGGGAATAGAPSAAPRLPGTGSETGESGGGASSVSALRPSGSAIAPGGDATHTLRVSVMGRMGARSQAHAAEVTARAVGRAVGMRLAVEPEGKQPDHATALDRAVAAAVADAGSGDEGGRRRPSLLVLAGRRERHRRAAAASARNPFARAARGVGDAPADALELARAGAGGEGIGLEVGEAVVGLGGGARAMAGPEGAGGAAGREDEDEDGAGMAGYEAAPGDERGLRSDTESPSRSDDDRGSTASDDVSVGSAGRKRGAEAAGGRDHGGAAKRALLADREQELEASWHASGAARAPDHAAAMEVLASPGTAPAFLAAVAQVAAMPEGEPRRAAIARCAVVVAGVARGQAPVPELARALAPALARAAGAQADLDGAASILGRLLQRIA